MTMTRLTGIDWVLPDAPPLRQPPLSLLQLAVPLIRVDDIVAAENDALEKLASAQVALTNATKRYEDASQEERAAAEEARASAASVMVNAEVWLSDQKLRLAELQRWEDGFGYLPELSNLEALEIFVPGDTKRTNATQTAFAWYDPFEVVAHDDRSLFGWPYTDFASRAGRAMRAELAHEPWQAEYEFWTGVKVPTNYHLSASPATATTTAKRTISAWPDPTAAPTTALGTAVGRNQALAALNQAIANADAGMGMIHATPYLVQLWMTQNPFIRDANGRIYTVNMNLIVPGYGYPGTGPDVADRSVADAVTNGTTTVTSATAAFTARDVGRSITTADLPAGTVIVSRTNATTVIVSQAATGSHSAQTITIDGQGGDATGSSQQWAYATDTVFSLQGAARTLPWDLGQAVPEALQNNSADIRAERSIALITNRLCRAAVLVDTTTA